MGTTPGGGGMLPMMVVAFDMFRGRRHHREGRSAGSKLVKMLKETNSLEGIHGSI